MRSSITTIDPKMQVNPKITAAVFHTGTDFTAETSGSGILPFSNSSAIEKANSSIGTQFVGTKYRPPEERLKPIENAYTAQK